MALQLDPVLWAAAAAPFLVLLVLLVGRRWPSSAAAPVALGVAVAAAMALFATPLRTLAIASGKGLWDALFILYVVWPSLVLYQVANDAGAFDAIREGVRRLLPDRLLVVLAFSWVLASFIQSIAGFGTPLAVTTPLLVGIGMRPVYAVVLPLIGAAWGNVFGSLGVPWLAASTVVDVASPETAIVRAALLLWIADAMAGIAIAWMYGRTWALRRAWPAILAVSTLHGGGQLLLAPLVPSLANLVATGAALAAVLALTRLPRYRRLDKDEPTRLFLPEAKTTYQLRTEEEARAQAEGAGEDAGSVPLPVSKATSGKPAMPLALAFAPYIVLALLAVLTLLVPPVRSFLSEFRIGFGFPAASTGLGLERAATGAYSDFAPFTHPGTLLLASAVIAYLLYRRRYGSSSPAGILRTAANAALPATTAIAALLLLSTVMDHSGQVDMLALGIAAVASPTAFVALGSGIGILGTMLTSSSTASNLLFGPLQAATATAEGLPAETVLANQVTGAAVGGAVAPGDAILGATVAGRPDAMGAVLAKTIPWTLVTGGLVALAAWALHVF